MDESVERELDALLGYMRAAQRDLAEIESGDAPGPMPTDPAGYVQAMTWAQASGALRILEHLGLLTAAERSSWESQATALVPRHIHAP